MPKVTEDLFDVRRIERALAEGHITPEQVQKHLESLEDCAGDAEESSIRMVAYDRSRRVEHAGGEAQHEEDEG
jgi:ribulose bisphosphate carboxylase small subunit